jgi:zinc protease
MSRLRLLLAAASLWAAGSVAFQPLLCAATPPPAAAPAFAQVHSDLAPDPAVRFGTLPNGVRYAILANAEPRGRASLRLLVDAGSFDETEEQRGLAHFLEHMGFNGSAHFAPGTLVEFFQRMGMSFGGDTNASTGFDSTRYLLELADTSDKTIDEGLLVFADYAGGLLLPAAEIDKERGIILSEKRARDSADFRAMLAQIDFFFGGTAMATRMPIGLEPVIQHAPRERFVDFYDTWYRPERMTVVAVGDFDPAQLEKKIVAAFAPLAARAPARPRPGRGTVDTQPGVRAGFHREPEAASTTVFLAVQTPAGRRADTAARRLADLRGQIAYGILNRRLDVLAKRENAPFIGAGAGAEDLFDFARSATVMVTCKPGQWEAALGAAEQELRRALDHGFLASEVAEVVAAYRNALEQAVKTASTRRSPDLASAFVDSVQSEQVFTSPAADLALLGPALETLTPADCLAALRTDWAPPGRRVFVAGNLDLPAAEAPALIVRAYERSAAVAVAAPAAEVQAAWAYADFGPAGRVVKREHVADLDLTLVTFANGIRLNLKKTPFEAGRIGLRARVGDGSKTEPAARRGLAAFAAATFDAGGLGRHSVDDLRRLLAGRNVGVGFAVDSDALVFSGGTTPDDLLLELQLLAAKLTDPGYRPEALRQVRKGIEQMYAGLAHTADGPMSTEVANLLANGDPRFGLPPQEQLLALTLGDVKTWLAPQLSSGAIEIALVGDLDPEAAIAAVARTLGALPERTPAAVRPELLRVAFPAAPFVRDYTFDSEIPKGLAALFWPTTDALDVHRARRLNLLTAVLSDRLRVKIREEMGGTYSPAAGSVGSETFPGYGYITTSVDVSPDQAGRIADAVVALAADLAAKGVTPDELERARLPVLTGIRESVRTNGYWLAAVLARAQSRPEVLAAARDREKDYAGITAAELDELARRYLGASRASRAIVLPAKQP